TCRPGLRRLDGGECSVLSWCGPLNSPRRVNLSENGEGARLVSNPRFPSAFELPVVDGHRHGHRRRTGELVADEGLKRLAEAQGRRVASVEAGRERQYE